MPVTISGTTGIGTPSINATGAVQAASVNTTGDIQSTGNIIGTGVCPAGVVLPFAIPTPPTGWLRCDGSVITTSGLVQGVDAALLQTLRNLLGTTYGATFGTLPNLQGQFIRGLTTNYTTASRDPLSASRVLGNVQGDAIRNITGSLNGVTGTTNLAYTGGFRPITDGAFDVPYSFGTYNAYGGAYTPSGGVGTTANFNASAVVPTAPENRPVNIALLYCIKY